MIFTTKMKQNKFKKSTIIPFALTVYLAIMAYYGRSMYFTGEKLQYFGVIGITSIIIIILHFSLKKKEQVKEQNIKNQYGKYNKENNSKDRDATSSIDNK